MFRKAARVITTIAMTLVILLANTIPVLAALSEDVTITWSPTGLFAPTNFTATRITDNQVRLDWTPNALAVTTMIVGKVGSYPVSAADGVVVYNGAGITVNDNSVSLEDTATNVFYRAWSVDGVGVLSANWAEANIGGVGMTLLAMGLIALGLSVAAFILKNGLFCTGGGGAFVVAGFYAYTQGAWPDNYSLIGLFLIVLGGAIMLEIGMDDEATPGAFRRITGKHKVDVNLGIDPDIASFRHEINSQRANIEAMRMGGSSRRGRKRANTQLVSKREANKYYNQHKGY